MPPAAEIYIQATPTDPAVRARTAVEDAHRRLLDRVADLTATGVPADGARAAEGAEPVATAEPAGAEVAADLRRLLTATDQTLYAAASGAAETRLLVRALRAAATVIGRQADRLATAGSAELHDAARTLAGMLTVHLAAERAVLLPALTTVRGVDLPSLVEDFGTLLAGGRLEELAVVDVREIPHGQRHPRIFTCFARLAVGESFTLVNNHDPKPLRREFEATHPGCFTWEYVESGPDRWQVRIGRVAEGA